MATKYKVKRQNGESYYIGDNHNYEEYDGETIQSIERYQTTAGTYQV